MSADTKRILLRMGVGAAIGVAVSIVLFIAAALVPMRFSAPAVQAAVPYSPLPGSGVRVSFVTTGVARAAGWRLLQGGGLGRVEVPLRMAIIEHSTGTLYFGTGASHDGPGPGVRSALANAEFRPVPDALPRPDRVILPTPRWHHLGGALQWPELAEHSIGIAGGDLWQARTGPWPRRYGIERSAVAEIGERVDRLTWSERTRLGFRRTSDVFGDESVVLVALKGSSIDEIGVLLTTDSGRRMLLVADAIWRMEQVSELRARGPASTWFMDRNRMQLAGLQSLLHMLWRDQGLEIIPMLDDRVDAPEFPEWWD